MGRLLKVFLALVIAGAGIMILGLMIGFLRADVPVFFARVFGSDDPWGWSAVLGYTLLVSLGVGVYFGIASLVEKFRESKRQHPTK